MSKTNNWTVIILIVQIVLSCVLLYTLIQRNSSLKKISYKNAYLSQKSSAYKQNSLCNYRLVGEKVNSDIILRNRENKFFCLKDILHTHRYLLIVPTLVCSSCFEEILEQLPQFYKKLHNEMIVLCDKNNILQINAYCKGQTKECIVYSIVNDELFPAISILPENVPCLLKVSGDKIQSLFLLFKDDMEFLNAYLDVESNL